MSLAKSKPATTNSSSIFMTVFENRRKCSILLDKELKEIEKARFVVMKQVRYMFEDVGEKHKKAL